MKDSMTARLLAFYLPQFHPIPENDEWWGKGFTEWTNVTKAKPLFPGHHQPNLPADLGFYDLRVPETRIAQADLAREHGIEGFCYWHYWFGNGRRILERPFTEVLTSGEPDFPFCLGWANESWTGIWHGAADRVLMEQTYPGMQDHEQHFNYLLKAFSDVRYITVEGKPLFIIFRPELLPDSKRVTDYWRELALKQGLKGLHIVGIARDFKWSPKDNGFDAVTMSDLTGAAVRASKGVWRLRHRPPYGHYIDQLIRHTPLRRPTYFCEYHDVAPDLVTVPQLACEWYPTVIPNWDNTPRSGMNGIVFQGSTPEYFRVHLRQAIKCVHDLPAERRLVLIKSWNEWAEGNYLEPDSRFGRRYLEVVREEVHRESSSLRS